MTHQTELHGKTDLVVLAPAKPDFQPIGRRQRIMADQVVFVGWNVEKLLTILNF